jgi:DNA adenine methylase
LLARCVKGSVRYSKNGKFNQSPDKRRHGTSPNKLKDNIMAVSYLLKGKTSFSQLDYKEVLDMAQPGDLVYMDPPYQGVTSSRDQRYYSGILFDDFVIALEKLATRGIDYLISYDGESGGKEYGESLPSHLYYHKVLLDAGLSSQAILLGRKSTTFESLYVSRSLMNVVSLASSLPSQMELSI